MTNEQKIFIENAVESLKKNKNIVGIAAAGSYITGEMDKFSDIDQVVAADPEHYSHVMKQRRSIAEKAALKYLDEVFVKYC